MSRSLATIFLCIAMATFFGTRGDTEVAPMLPESLRGDGKALEQESQEQKISREKLIEDILQLADQLEAAHPDPYIRGGGKIAFHIRLHRLILSVPDEGFTQIEFYNHIMPFLAALQDAHTFMVSPIAQAERSGGLPFEFKITGDEVCICGVAGEDYASHLGAKLIAVQGIGIAELLARQAKLVGHENEYYNLYNFAGSLGDGNRLRLLVPEWDGGPIALSLESANGTPVEISVDLAADAPLEFSRPESRIRIPSERRIHPVYTYLDDGKKAALLKIENCSGYREALEAGVRNGRENSLNWARSLYSKFNEGEAPEDPEALLSGLPSACETIRTLASEMKAASTETLIIDLRGNGGGASLISDILVYFLYGRDSLRQIGVQYVATKYSDLYYENYPDANIEEVNKDRVFALRRTDYNFYGLYDAYGKKSDTDREIDWRAAYLNQSPTFAEEVASGTFSAYYTPANIIAVTSPGTMSSGFWIAADLQVLGARLAGVPSGQAANSFGDLLAFNLKNSGIRVAVSRKQFIRFLDDPEKGRLLKTDLTLTYEDYKRFDFDPNAEILMILEELGPAQKQR